ncbi:hypothetical protein BH23ACT12_BH23ACT12_18780 [soil metagenome]
MTYVVAAGNNAQRACKYSPARVPAALTIGASTESDAKASFSNHGSCVDWYAPGAGITSSSNLGDTTTATWDGTSMASPHTAGVAALFLQSSPAATPADVRSSLASIISKKRIKVSGRTYKDLLYTNY